MSLGNHARRYEVTSARPGRYALHPGAGMATSSWERVISAKPSVRTLRQVAGKPRLEIGLRCHSPGLDGRREPWSLRHSPLWTAVVWGHLRRRVGGLGDSWQHGTARRKNLRPCCPPRRRVWNPSTSGPENGPRNRWPHHRDEGPDIGGVRPAPGRPCRLSQPFAPVRLGQRCRGCSRARSVSALHLGPRSPRPLA